MNQTTNNTTWLQRPVTNQAESSFRTSRPLHTKDQKKRTRQNQKPPQRSQDSSRRSAPKSSENQKPPQTFKKRTIKRGSDSRGRSPRSSRASGHRAVLKQAPSRSHVDGSRVYARTGRNADSDRARAVSDQVLRIYPLGGNEEVGRNCTIFEWGNDIIVLDVGVQFPEEDMPGVDYIIPNITSLKGKEKNIRGVILSHGHLDHIGAVPHIIPELGNPTVIGSDITLALAKKRNEEFEGNPNLRTMTIKKSGDRVKLGKFTVEFFNVAHSIRDSFGVIIQTQFVNIIHMGDWRYDLDPVEGPPTDFSHLAKWNTKKIPSLLAMESLGAIHEGFQGSEKDVYKSMEDIIENAVGRVIFGTFSSMLERIGQVMELSEKRGRKVAIDGYSMKAAVEIGKRFGYIKIKQSNLIPISQVNKYPAEKVTVICTGSQGEGRAVLMRIANGEHRHVRIEPNDTVVFSSSVIPGNERSIQKLKDSLYRQGANVVHKEIMDEIHAGGHAKKEDIKLLLKQVKPEYLMPVYANYYILKEAERLIVSQGIPKEKIFVLDNGQILEIDKKGPRVTKTKVQTDYVFVDGLGVGDVSNIVLRDRQIMAGDGMLVLIATIYGKTGELVQNPDIISRGFIYLKENKRLVEDIRRRVRKVLENHHDPRTPAQDSYIKDRIRNDIGQFIFQKTERRPMILPVVIIV